MALRVKTTPIRFPTNSLFYYFQYFIVSFLKHSRSLQLSKKFNQSFLTVGVQADFMVVWEILLGNQGRFVLITGGTIKGHFCNGRGRQNHRDFWLISGVIYYRRTLLDAWRRGYSCLFLFIYGLGKVGYRGIYIDYKL